jgi:hypothetical protein
MQQKRWLKQPPTYDVSRPRHGIFSVTRSLALGVTTLTGLLWSIPALSAGVDCRFKADTDPVEVQVLLGGKEYWHEKIQKGETKTVTIPEGSFTVISKVYNPNLKTMEDVRTESHTRLCTQRAVLSVPLFTQER